MDTTDPHQSQSPSDPFDPAAITRPDPSLLRYYIITSALTIVGFPFVIIPFLIRYHTLHYSLDDKGVAMSWGILFKKEIYLTYRRIQDIHVTRNIIERWMGLAKVAIQTASGASGAEMTIEGIKKPELLRNFLYQQMRGAKGEGAHPTPDAAPDQHEAAQPPESDEALALLTDIRDELKRIRATREADSNRESESNQ